MTDMVEIGKRPVPFHAWQNNNKFQRSQFIGKKCFIKEIYFDKYKNQKMYTKIQVAFGEFASIIQHIYVHFLTLPESESFLLTFDSIRLYVNTTDKSKPYS